MNQYPLWKYILLIVLVVFGVLYSLPNLYGDKPALQISSAEHGVIIDTALEKKVDATLKAASIEMVSSYKDNASYIVQLADTDVQAKAQEVVKQTLGDNYTTALYLMPTTPHWLQAIGSSPMRLGLDLRGGVHFLLSVDVDSVFKHQADGDVRNIGQSLREDKVRYAGIATFNRQQAQGLVVKFRDEESADKAYNLVRKTYNNYAWSQKTVGDQYQLIGSLGEAQYQKVRQNTMDQSMTILRKRVNELGVSEAVVTQQGADEIAVDLPGIQDAAQAQNIIGKTATLEFHLVDTTQDAFQAAQSGVVPVNDQLEYNQDGRPFLLTKEIILGGASITNASSNFGEQGAEVNIKLAGGSAVTKFNKVTGQNVGKPLAVLYVETKPVTKTVNDKEITTYETDKRVINAATINSALGNSFRITGLSDMHEAANLSLLLRAGALPVPIHIIQERTIGPSLGQSNIDKGVVSIEVGFAIVVIFMAIYYRAFGIFADIALGMNLVLIVAIMSLLGAVMTLPGIAGMVLTVGMAVDANVLIFERIREELRNGISPQAAIFSGYQLAMTTIVDANVTTLIVAIVLFSLGSGAVKGFAVTLTIGLITSMITSIVGTRALVNLLYGNKNLKKLSLGIKMPERKKPFTERNAANS